MRNLLAATPLLFALLTGCTLTQPLEVVQFEHFFVTPNAQGGYDLPSPADPRCQSFYAVANGMTLTQLAPFLQAQSGATAGLETCGNDYTARDADIKATSRNKLQYTGFNGVQISLSRPGPGSTHTAPQFNFLISAENVQTLFQKSIRGRVVATIQGEDWQASSGSTGTVWAVNFSSNDTFVEMELTSEGVMDTTDANGNAIQIPWVSGRFAGILRNTTDPSDGRLLVIMHGGFTMIRD